MHEYAWLEFDGGMWHFLTRFNAGPGESLRRWPGRQPALAELAAEGWAIVRPYPQLLLAGISEDVCGYGLIRRRPLG